MGCDLVILLDRWKPKVDVAELTCRLLDTPYSRNLNFPNVPKWSVLKEEESEIDLLAADRRCEIKVRVNDAIISTDTGVLEFVSDQSYQNRILNLVDMVAQYLSSTVAIYVPDDIHPFQDMRESVLCGDMNVEDLAIAIMQSGKQASAPSEMGTIKTNGLYFECTRSFVKRYNKNGGTLGWGDIGVASKS